MKFTSFLYLALPMALAACLPQVPAVNGTTTQDALNAIAGHHSIRAISMSHQRNSHRSCLVMPTYENSWLAAPGFHPGRLRRDSPWALRSQPAYRHATRYPDTGSNTDVHSYDSAGSTHTDVRF
jgi:hypothetical protein